MERYFFSAPKQLTDNGRGGVKFAWFSLKWSWTEKPTFPSSFDTKEVIVLTKHPVSFRTQNFVVNLKTAYTEARLPKRQLVECTTLWCNSVDRHRLRSFRSASLRHHFLFRPRPPIRTCSVYERCKLAGLSRNQTIKIALKTTRRCAVPSCEKNSICVAFLLFLTLEKSERSLFLMKIQTASVRLSLILCSLHFTANLLTKKAQFDAGFS